MSNARGMPGGGTLKLRFDRYIMKQECSVIVGWRDFTPFKLCDYVNSFPRLSDFTDCGVKHSKYSTKFAVAIWSVTGQGFQNTK